MSSFEGKLLEDSLDFIRIDQFLPENHDGTAFFLSHFHMDHCRGLFRDEFLKILTENNDKLLYCTAVTKNLILRHKSCKIPEDKICIVNSSLLLIHADRPPVLVTTVPAAHCPGSTMFLFEQDALRVLYTGDFRMNPKELHKLQAFHNKDGSLKKINTLYLDTTFCDPRFPSFPSREQTLQDLIEIIKDWLDSDRNHKVGICYNSYYGMEPLLLKLAKSLKIRISVLDDDSYINYSCIAELQPALCRSDASSKVHLCSVKQMLRCSVCSQDRRNVKTIKPCAQSFDYDQLELGSRKEGTNGLVRIAYSMHCSLEELIGTVKYLKPDFVYPCVVPGKASKQMILDNLKLDVDKLKQELKRKREKNGSSPSSFHQAKKFCLSTFDEDEVDDYDEEEDDDNFEEEEGVKGEKMIVVERQENSDEEENQPLSQHSIDSPPL